MKKMNQVIFAAVAAATLGLAGQVNAGDDGIAASPKVRQMLNERRASANVAVVASKPQPSTTSVNVVAAAGITASPKANEFLSQFHSTPVTVEPAASVASIGYKPVGNDGIAASPKLREQLNQRNSAITVAPVK